MDQKPEHVKQLLEGVKQMDADSLDEFVNQVLLIKAQRSAPHLSAEESLLMAKINQGLSEADQARLQQLIEKRQAELLSDSENQELNRLTNQVENLDAERLRWLGELAKVRNLSVRELIQQLQLSAS